MSIRELNGHKFEIPVYQRGFRWTRQQIKELIDDLYVFSKDKKKTSYCLQNITIREIENRAGETVFEVIDGQQRLTAIWILVMAYMNSNRYDGGKMPIYHLHYEEKTALSDYVKRVTDAVCEGSGSQTILDCERPSNIDAAYIRDAFSYIINEYKFAEIAYSRVLDAIFSDDFFNNEKKIEIIWNEVELRSVEEDDRQKKEEAQTKYVIERFSNLNANKIPLTESELIKAHFITRMDDGQAEQFSHQWEAMERGLNDNALWNFISSGREEETRMDLLFRVYTDVDHVGQHDLSRMISSALDAAGQPKDIWVKIKEVYETLRDWYEDYYFYHMIGLIVAIEKQDCTKIIRDLYNRYTSSTKEDFKAYLKQRIRKAKEYEISFSSRGREDWDVNQPGDIILQSRDIAYGRSNDRIKPLLLLFNISLLVNAYAVNPENAVERFPFMIYKSKDNPIEIEHINPKHLEGRDANKQEYTPEKKKQWAIKTLEVITNLTTRDDLAKNVETANWNNKNNSLIDQIEEAANLNTLSNLTLVDKNLNIRYGDRFFNEKRNNILAARFGQPIHLMADDASDNPDRNYYKQSVIFPGTMWVFMRQYRNARDADRWTAKDQENYIACMQTSIYTLLNSGREEVTDHGTE